MLTPLQIVMGPSISRSKEPRYWSSCPTVTTNMGLQGKFQYECLRRRIYGTDLEITSAFFKIMWKLGESYL